MQVQSAVPPTTLAVSFTDAQKFGCPHCGGIFGSSPISGGGSQVWNCADCGETSIYVNDGLGKSTIGVGDTYPAVQPHPRRDGPVVDRDKIIADRANRIHTEAVTDLNRWLTLGYGQRAHSLPVGSHHSKSYKLPIIGCSDIGTHNADVTCVTWFGYNYYFYFMGVALMNPIPATLLYPIAGIFGSYALSGHVNTKIAPPITNFEKLYHNCTPVQRFGGDCGNSGIRVALTLRYLEEISKLDMNGILDVCLRKTRYGETDVIDGNGVDFNTLLKLLGIEGGELYKEVITNAPQDIFESIKFDWFGTHTGHILGGSAIQVTMREGILMSSLPSPAEVSLELKDTLLGMFGPKDVLPRIPASCLGYRRDQNEERYLLYEKGGYQPHGFYHKANIGTRAFALHTPNVLDSALTAFFLIKVLAPVLKAVRQS